MKIIKITLVIVLFLVNSHGQDTSVEDDKTVSLSLTLIKYDQSNLALAIKLRNSGTVPAYVAVDPVHPNGKKAYYLTLGDDNSLLIESRVFGPRANVHYLKDQTKVDLKRLEPLEEYDLEIKLQTPLRETFPSLVPNKSATTFRDRLYRKIDLSTTRRIQVNIGYFEASKGIDDLLSRMIGTAVNGIMSPAVGTDQNKSLYEIQKLATGEIRLQSTTRSAGFFMQTTTRVGNRGHL
ncbi:MAG: hypothetical protein WBD16_00210 [Pyrinomonadaceae bacterium]